MEPTANTLLLNTDIRKTSSSSNILEGLYGTETYDEFLKEVGLKTANLFFSNLESLRIETMAEYPVVKTNLHANNGPNFNLL